MKKVTGIGGVFIKMNNVDTMKDWYAKNLGVELDNYGGRTFRWREEDAPDNIGHTVFSMFKADSDYFAPSEKPFMVNFRVDDLLGLLEKLRAEGVTVLDKVEEFEYGKFGWILDPEGNKIELWEPPAGDPFPDEG